MFFLDLQKKHNNHPQSDLLSFSFASTKAIIYYTRINRFYVIVCIPKLEIFGLRFLCFLKCHKRKVTFFVFKIM